MKAINKSKKGEPSRKLRKFFSTTPLSLWLKVFHFTLLLDNWSFSIRKIGLRRRCKRKSVAATRCGLRTVVSGSDCSHGALLLRLESGNYFEMVNETKQKMLRKSWKLLVVRERIPAMWIIKLITRGSTCTEKSHESADWIRFRCVACRMCVRAIWAHNYHAMTNWLAV